MAVDMAAVSFVVARAGALAKLMYGKARLYWHAAQAVILAYRVLRSERKRVKLLLKTKKREQLVAESTRRFRELTGAKLYLVGHNPERLAEYLRVDLEDPTVVTVEDESEIPARGKYDQIERDPAVKLAERIKALMDAGLVEYVHAETPSEGEPEPEPEVEEPNHTGQYL